MPGYDKKGPNGQGPATGGQRGSCKENAQDGGRLRRGGGMGRGAGGRGRGGRGLGRQGWNPADTSPQPKEEK